MSGSPSHSQSDIPPHSTSATQTGMFVLPEIDEGEYSDEENSGDEDDQDHDHNNDGEDDDDDDDDNTCLSSASRMSAPFIQFAPSIGSPAPHMSATGAGARARARDSSDPDPDEIDYSHLGFQNVEAENKPELIACVNTVNALAEVNDADDEEFLAFDDEDDPADQVAQPPNPSLGSPGPGLLQKKWGNHRKDAKETNAGAGGHGGPGGAGGAGAKANSRNTIPPPSGGFSMIPRLPSGGRSTSLNSSANSNNSFQDSDPNVGQAKKQRGNMFRNKSSVNVYNDIAHEPDHGRSTNEQKDSNAVKKKKGFLSGILPNHVQADYARDADISQDRREGSAGSVRSHDDNTLGSNGMVSTEMDGSMQSASVRSHHSRGNAGRLSPHVSTNSARSSQMGSGSVRSSQMSTNSVRSSQMGGSVRSNQSSRNGRHPSQHSGYPLHQQQYTQQQLQRQGYPQGKQQPEKKKGAGARKFAKLIMGNHVQTDFSHDERQTIKSKPSIPLPPEERPPIEVMVGPNQGFDPELEQMARESEAQLYTQHGGTPKSKQPPRQSPHHPHHQPPPQHLVYNHQAAQPYETHYVQQAAQQASDTYGEQQQNVPYTSTTGAGVAYAQNQQYGVAAVSPYADMPPTPTQQRQYVGAQYAASGQYGSNHYTQSPAPRAQYTGSPSPYSAVPSQQTHYVASPPTAYTMSPAPQRQQYGAATRLNQAPYVAASPRPTPAAQSPQVYAHYGQQPHQVVPQQPQVARPPQGGYEHYRAGGGYDPAVVSQQRQRVAQEIQRRDIADEEGGDKRKKGLKGLFARKKSDAGEEQGSYDYSTEYSSSNDLRNSVEYDTYDYAATPAARPRMVYQGRPGH